MRPRITKPGRMLQRIAPFLFNERFLSLVVRPTLADLESEIKAAGPDRMKRVRARWRGYRAFWTLVFVAPFASWSDDRLTMAVDPVAAGSAVITLLTVIRFGARTGFIVAAGGTLVALLIHAWNTRHPTHIAMPPKGPWRSPQINFSSTDVPGNIGGLIFVVGSVVIVSLGLPVVFWFLLAGAIAACFVAWGLAAWHTRTRSLVGRPLKLSAR